MNAYKKTADRKNATAVSLVINIVYAIIIFGAIKFLNLYYFEDFWTNWVIFVSCLAIAYIAWKELDPYKSEWHLKAWMSHIVGVMVLVTLAFTIGFK